MKQLIFTICILCNAGYLLAQASAEVTDDPAANFAATINSSDLKDHLSILSSDEFEGRETGTEGNKKAANYLANYFKELGLPAIGENQSYFQDVSFTWTMWEKANIFVNGERYKHLWEFLSFPNTEYASTNDRNQRGYFLRVWN